MTKKIVVLVALISSLFIYAQEVTIVGEVYDEYLEPFSGAIVRSSQGHSTVSRYDGTFKLDVILPVEIVVSSDGYSTERIKVTEKDDRVNLILKEKSSLDEVVVSASRTPEKIFESPVSVERLGLNSIKSTPSVSFYEGLSNLRGVTTYNNSRTVQVVNTRGFTNLRNIRYVQLVDGVDNLAPVQSIALGNLSAVNDLDLESVEVLPGASSALYGANAFNGLILVNTKNPFEYPGTSTKIKGGVTNQEDGLYKGFYDFKTRVAFKLNNYFAAKVSVSNFEGEEWSAKDYRNIVNGKVVNNSKRGISYNGVNVYGDKVLSFKKRGYINYLNNPDKAPKVEKIPNIFVSRTGYKEEDLIDDNKARNKSINASVHFRPLGNKNLEISWTSKFSKAKYLYQAPPVRYSVENHTQTQHILEFKGDNYTLRGYGAFNKLQETYNLKIIGNYLSEGVKNSVEWLDEYMKEYSETGSHSAALNEADSNRLRPGSRDFKNAVSELKSKLLYLGGADVNDFSGFYHADGNFNFGKYTDVADIQVGFSYRRYILDSNGGSVFTDYDDKIKFDEYGVYSQIQRKFINDRLKLVGSLRYDKSKNFEGNVSPRISGIFSFGKDNNQNFRVSFQTAFRNPTIQDQYFGLQVGQNSFRIGNTEDNKKRIRGTIKDPLDKKNPEKNIFKYIKNSGFSKISFENFVSGLISGLTDQTTERMLLEEADRRVKEGELEVVNFNSKLKSEKVQTLEAGYKGIFYLADRMLELDVNSYYSKYKDFITNRSAYISLDPKADVNETKQIVGNDEITDKFTRAVVSILTNRFTEITMPVNSKATINSYGATVSLKTKVFKNFDLNTTYSWADFDFNKKKDKYFKPGFNTPKHSFKIMLGNKKLFKNIGVNAAYRWQSKFDWESPFADGSIDAQSLIDAQITYNIPALNSRLKLGGNNLLNKGYYNGIGSGKIGSTYFLSWIIND